MTPAELRVYLRAWWGAVDGDRLRHVGILTYFGTYGLILLGGREAVNATLGVLPAAVRPGPLPPLTVVLGLPVSVAWGVTSLVVALLAVALLLADARPRSVSRLPAGEEREEREEGEEGEPAGADGTDEPADPADAAGSTRSVHGHGEGSGTAAGGSRTPATDGLDDRSGSDDDDGTDEREPAYPGGRSP